MENNGGSVLMKKYEVGRLLGKGTFAKVYYARSIQSGHGVAIKVIDKDKILKVGLNEQIKREICSMRLVRHPNIVQLYEVMATKTKIYFVLEYAKGGELFNKVAKGKLKEDVARKYFRQLINAVDFCHSRGVYHRDLKPENLLLDEHDNLKVSDFGLSALADSKRQGGLLHTTCGTPAYVAPEVINRKGYDGAKADIWSCGVVLYVLLAGYLPFHDSNLMELYRKIGKGDFKCPNWFAPEVRRLLNKILDPNPVSRISAAKIRETMWFKKGLAQQAKKEQEIKTKETTTSTSTSTSTIIEEEDKNKAPYIMNAFDIISRSPGFDLSGWFYDEDLNLLKLRETRFSCKKSVSVIISKIQEIADNLKLKVKRKERGLYIMEGDKEGRKGILSIEAEILQVTPSLHLVEMKKSNGDTMEYEKMFKDEIRPALKDIVWAWQDEQQ